ncbi:MAG: hypothetical protein HZC18_00625 [Candidatus Omnitrophica bacterium]|nr:hypothetical protein [Candidatus Omnitrophota bacterium]
MNNEILSEIRNKLTAPKIALERLAKGEKVPKEFLELAAEELNAAAALLQGEKIIALLAENRCLMINNPPDSPALRTHHAKERAL